MPRVIVGLREAADASGTDRPRISSATFVGRRWVDRLSVNGARKPTLQGADRSLELRMLSGFELRWQGAVVELPPGPQRLLAFLALEGRSQLRAHVAGALWPRVSDERAGASLRSALWRLHRSGHPLVASAFGRIGLAAEVDVDVHRVLALARDLQDRTTPEISLEAAALLDGDLLPEWYDDWVVPERERHRQVRLHALERLAIVLMEEGRFADAIDVGLRAMAADPLRESAHRTLIRVHLIEGNRAEAIRQFEAYRALLWLELGIEPSPAMMELVSPLSPLES